MLVKHPLRWVLAGMCIAAFLFLTGLIALPAAVQLMETWHGKFPVRDDLSKAKICNEQGCIGPGD